MTDDGMGAGRGTAPDVTTVAICACTFHRPKGLTRLLSELAALDPLEPVGAEVVRVVIVDNDPEGSAAPVVDAARAAIPWELRYVVEPERGIPAARNAAVAAAGDVDAVAFLDDDEWPEPGWLAELVRVQRATGAHVVTGTVLPAFDVAPPPWVVSGRFFDRPRFATGQAIHYARTSNVLIGAGVLRQGRFEAMGAVGGDDSHFFHRAHLRGERIVWADDAVVHEAVPETRVNPRWLVLRQYRNGLTRSVTLRSVEGTPLRYLRRALNGALLVLQGLGMALVSPGRGRAARVRAAMTAARGAGLVAGLFGAGYDEYKTVHGQ